MSDHLIAEANRHAKALPKMTLPTTKPNDRDLAWYVRECEWLDDRNRALAAEVDQWAARCAAAIWMLPETVTGGQLRAAQDKFHRERENLRRENAALLKALKEIEAYGPHDGCCRYGCDTPGIAMAAIDAARKEAQP